MKTMILKLTLLLGVYISSVAAQADQSSLRDIVDTCFKYPTLNNGEYYVNGQKYPLAHTLKNFISLVEKLEFANPDLKLDSILTILLRNFTADNVKVEGITGNDILLQVWKPPTAARYEAILNLWENDLHKEIFDYNNPFEDEEKCSLFFMLSRTMNNTARNIDTPYAVNNDEPIHAAARKTSNAREQGVVAIYDNPTDAVALGRVILGLKLGLKDKSQRLKMTTEYDIAPNIQDILNTKDKAIDPLYFATLADQLILSSYVQEKNGISKNGRWTTVNGNGNERGEFPICPTVYLHENNIEVETPAVSYASLKGGVDGLILGEAIKEIYNSQSDIRLSQILRMYYSPVGLRLESTRSPEPVTFCYRFPKIQPLEPTLKDQRDLYLAMITKSVNKGSLDEISKKAEISYTMLKNEISDSSLVAFCTLNQKRNFLSNGNGMNGNRMPNGNGNSNGNGLTNGNGMRNENGNGNGVTNGNGNDLANGNGIRIGNGNGVDENQSCEAATDIIIVLDTTTTQDDLTKQRTIVGKLANRLDMWMYGSTMTVFTDIRNTTFPDNLTVLIDNTTSSACVACSAVQLPIQGGNPPDKVFIVNFINRLLVDVKEQERSLSGARGKVVIFFNFKGEEPERRDLRNSLSRLYEYQKDVKFLAVGSNKKVLQLYTQGKLQNDILVDNQNVLEEIEKRICSAPSHLKYEDCKSWSNEAGAIFEGLVSPNSPQRWAMYPQYFLKTLHAKMFFESESNSLQVCATRANAYPEVYPVNCQISSPGKRLEFNVTNPCKGFTVYNCAPWYFTVSLARDTSADLGRFCRDQNSALKCKTEDQVRFKVSHEGVRCSSCSGLVSTPALLLGCFLTYILSKIINF